MARSAGALGWRCPAISDSIIARVESVSSLEATAKILISAHRVVSQAVVIATGVAADGNREVLGFVVGDSDDGAFWTAFLRSLKARGLGGVQLVISDSPAGLKTAIGSVLLGAAWQRCRVHFLRNVLAQVPKGSAAMVAATVRTIFAQPGPDAVREQLGVIAGMLGWQFPRVEAMLLDAAEDMTAFAAFPIGHWKKIWSTNPLERLPATGPGRPRLRRPGRRRSGTPRTWRCRCPRRGL